MDWKYLLSLNVEELNDDEKDELYNSVTWFDLDSENLEETNYKALIRASQEILKYKGEQVETLLHELEEMAVKQAEDDVRRQESEAEVKSSRSRKSSSIEYENLEQKYQELKSKQKKVIKTNEKQEIEINKLNNKIKILEQENRRLQNEIQSRSHDVGSESDISESIRDKQNELVETLHNKNKQISELLRDIEEVEKENSVLRDKLSKVRDELSTATEEITSLMNILKEKKSEIEANKDITYKLNIDNENLRTEIKTLKEETSAREQEMSKTIADLNKNLEDLQDDIKSKEDIIQTLKSRLKEPSLNSSISSLPKDEPDKEQITEQSHVTALQKALNDREKQLLELQTQLQIATKEMDEASNVLMKLKSQNKEERTKQKELREMNIELKKQLKTSHERSQNLHDELNFVQETVRSKDEELKQILNKIQEDGQIDLALNFRAIHDLKADNRLKEKQIISLVKTSNKLQETCEILEKENCALRDTMGIPEDESINLTGYTLKQKKLKKEIEYHKHQLINKEETIIQLKSNLHQLNKVISSLTNQILELGQKPSCDLYLEKSDLTLTRNEEMKNLVEENDALRKGLHEIMTTINTKKSQIEIKSNTLEQLLRALDVKHVTGWYHPAMRLQAELHNLEGINSELREQLRQARDDLKSVKDYRVQQIQQETDDCNDSDTMTTDSGVHLQELTPENVEENIKTLLEMAKPLKKKKVDAIQQQVSLWLSDLVKSKNELNDALKVSETTLKALQEEQDVLLEKLKILLSETDEEKVKKINDIIATNIKLNRKVVYLENESKKHCDKIESLEKDLNNINTNYIRTITDLKNKNQNLEASLKISQDQNSSIVNYTVYKELETNLDNITLKYRNLCSQINQQEENVSLEIKMLNEVQKSLENDKTELSSKLAEMLTNEAVLSVQIIEDKERKLAEKLAEAEIKEITERQRANHINNLYELVKEQLNKSEEKFKEYTKFNEELLKKNLTLQEQLKDVTEDLCEYIDVITFEQLKKTNNELVKEHVDLNIKINNLETELNLEKQSKHFEKTWNDLKVQELLNLKHQIVDLISISDEKVIIAQLSGDVLQNRKLVEYYKVNFNGLNEELAKMRDINEEIKRIYEEQVYFAGEREEALKKKIGHLQSLLNSQRIQFFGYVPIVSDELYISNLITIKKQKHETFLSLQKARELEIEATILRDTLKIELDYVKKQKEISSEGCQEDYKNLLNWMQEKKAFQISELRLKRQSEFKESQLQHYMERVKIQDDQISKLDQELLQIYKNFDTNLPQKEVKPIQEEPIIKTPREEPVPKPRKLTRSVSVQANEPNTKIESSEDKGMLVNLKSELLNLREELSVKETQADQLKSKITEHEMTISMFRKQIGDKQSQISFYEKHIMELQSKKAEISNGGAGGDNISVGNELVGQNEENLVLKNSIKTLHDDLKVKDEQIIKYQTLLKTDRDNHSLAAATLQEELQNLQKQLADEKLNAKSLEETYNKTRPTRAAIEQYVAQVHALEKHTSELHTKLSSVEAQLQSCRQETIRWKTMANDRLVAMEELRSNLDKQHQAEMDLYKSDTEKMKEIGNDEMNCLRQIVLRQKGELTGRLDTDIQRLIREKDDKIHELIIKLRQMKNIKKTDTIEPIFSPKKSDIETINDTLTKENELWKKRYEQLLTKEKNAREEINSLKLQLIKKPISARSDRSDKSIKDQLQKKITSMEKEICDLKQNLQEQISIHETHKIQANQEFDKWKKMKHWQQSSEKLKNKLKERDDEFQKIQQTNAGYRLLIERLEREKRNLENRVKTLKCSNLGGGNIPEIEVLKLENMKLVSDLEALKNKMEIQQHHAGAIGATMLQEKLEAQERKIAILELTAKGTTEVRTELERLQTTNSTLQKTNLRLEAENLDLKLDLEKSIKEVPHLQQQIRHLENYVDVLKTESTKQQTGKANDITSLTPEAKKVSELERTVFILKRVVEKLQAENKRLVSGRRPLSDRSPSGEKLKRDFVRLKEQHSECTQKIEQLQKELEVSKNTLKNISLSKKDDKTILLSKELSTIKEQLEVKSGLLDKVKVLLHRAAAKEKMLLDEIANLKTQRSNLNLSPILEGTRQSSVSDM